MRAETVSEHLILAAVQPRVVDATSGEDVSHGSGFLLGVDAGGGQFYPVLITNKHVRDLGEGQRFHVRLPMRDKDGRLAGAARDYDLTDRRFIGHPDPTVDVLAVALDGSAISQSALRALPEEMLYDSARDDGDLDAIEEVTIIGFPNALRNTSTHLGIVMRGVTASPIEDLYSGLRGFAVDASVVGGSSGSMVVAGRRGALTPDRSGAVRIGGGRTFIAGIIAQTHVRAEFVRGVPVTSPDVAPFVMMPHGLGIAFNGTTIREVCDEVRRVAAQS